jgi:hypothetical protein
MRVFIDPWHEWPVWETGDKYVMEPSDYGFSDELTDLLRRWHDAWEPVASFDIGQIEEPPDPEREPRSTRSHASRWRAPAATYQRRSASTPH